MSAESNVNVVEFEFELVTQKKAYIEAKNIMVKKPYPRAVRKNHRICYERSELMNGHGGM